MSNARLNFGPAIFAAALAVTATASQATGTPPTPFEEATMYVEQNATDEDTEIVISGTAGDEGLRLLRITSPDGRRVVNLLAPDTTTLGMREFAFESPEPPGEAVLAAYPEGKYVLYGISTSDEVFRSVLTLSHQLPAAATILQPADGAVVPDEALIIRWSAVTGIEQYILEFENESADPEQALTINLAPNVTSFRIPNRLIVPGGEYQIGVHTVGENGNVVAVESTFTVAD